MPPESALSGSHPVAPPHARPLSGIPPLDEQHQYLLDCLNRLEYWIRQGRALAASLDALASLTRFVNEHFAREEDWMRQHACPTLARHLEQHQGIRADIDRCTNNVIAGADVTDELMSLLRYWISTHIGIEDMEVAAWRKLQAAEIPEMA